MESKGYSVKIGEQCETYCEPDVEVLVRTGSGTKSVKQLPNAVKSGRGGMK